MEHIFFTGVCTALVTPFKEGKIHYPMLEELLVRQLEAGIPAVVLSGTTGESATLSDTEKLQLLCHAKKFVGSGCKILLGTGSNNTAHAVSLSHAAEDAGADGVLVVSPYYNKASAEGLFLHYSAIASALRIPVIAYNVPSRTGVDIPVRVYRELAEIANLAGIKEASPDITKILQIRAECPDLPIWSGNDDQIVPAMALGGAGVISVLSNVLPVETLAMAKAALDGDFDTAAALQIRLYPLIRALFSDINPIPVKAALEMIGLDCGPCRMPLTPLNQENRKKLKKALSSL